MPHRRPSAPAAKKPPKSQSQKQASHRSARYYLDNRDRILANRKNRYHAKTPAEKLELTWRTAARPHAPRGKPKTQTQQRRAALAKAFCDWSDLDEVVRIYCAAALMSELTGETYVVDHSVPLQSPLVCGLHTHTNLQVLTETENRRKGFWIWPDMWPMTHETLEILLEAERFA